MARNKHLNSLDTNSNDRGSVPRLIVISGPSGVGKDSVINSLRTLRPDWDFAITATTRNKRIAEVDSVDYYFMTNQEFMATLDKEGFFEYAKVYDNWYGVPRRPIEESLSKGNNVILKVDVQGARTIRGLAPEGLFIFLIPPSIEELRNRLHARSTESNEELQIRLLKATDEIKESAIFDYVITNDDLQNVVKDIISIIDKETSI